MTFPILKTEVISSGLGNIYFSCPGCRKPVTGRVQRKSGAPIDMTAVDKWDRSLSEAGHTVTSTWPGVQATSAPDAVPDSVARNFIQAEEANRRQHREAAGMAYRRALELALKDLAPTLKGTLEKRIDKLAEQARLTPDIAEWAHSVRELGNEATHDEPEPTLEDLEDLAVFTRLVLEYLYTMPAKVKNRTISPTPAISTDKDGTAEEGA